MELKVLCLGSCRLDEMKHLGASTLVTQTVTYTHSTKDTLQILKWLSGIINIPSSMTKYIMHRGMWGNKEIILTDELKSLFNESECFIVEICSYHTYQVNNYSCYAEIIADPYTNKAYTKLQHIPTEIRNSVKRITDTKFQIKEDIDEIIKLIGNRKLIIVTHVNEKNSIKIPHRKELIDDLTEICLSKNIPIIYPGDILDENGSGNTLIKDAYHYTSSGLLVLREFYRKKLVEFGLQ